MKFCKIRNCSNKHYAKEYCKKHYEAIITRRGYKKKKCPIKNCTAIIYSKSKYCIKHTYRIIHNLPLDLSINCINIKMNGKNNPRWNGGVSEYPDHCIMKKNRLIILINNPKCEICGALATQIHHKDFSKSNHKLSNLKAICPKCNSKLSNKYYQKYGFTMQEIVQMIGRNSLYWRKHKYELDQIFTRNKK